MDKPERDELEELAQAAHGERWCLHPNGTSVWTGEEYDVEGKKNQEIVCRVPAHVKEDEFHRIEFIAACSPHALLELLEFYGLSETRIEHGLEDSDEVCVVCGYATTEGHTHGECFEHGKGDGAQEENLECASKLCVALGIENRGYYFHEAFEQALVYRSQMQRLRSDALLLTTALLKRPSQLNAEESAAVQRVLEEATERA